ncbi:MAG: hypothetical protein EOP06_07585 [Proteobacteria bacterium]|nr:MAG: hypothetical protein EOP06_07585 [Pseudomonadota bacterium]
MTDKMTVFQDMPPLTIDEIDDALFRGRDRAWLAAAGMFDQKRVEGNITYQALADRIDRKKSQVHYWLKSASNMTLKTLGLLAEGMDSDLEIRLVPRIAEVGFRNYCHPSVVAENIIVMKSFDDQGIGEAVRPLKSSFMTFSVESEDA